MDRKSVVWGEAAALEGGAGDCAWGRSGAGRRNGPESCGAAGQRGWSMRSLRVAVGAVAGAFAVAGAAYAGTAGDELTLPAAWTDLNLHTEPMSVGLAQAQPEQPKDPAQPGEPAKDAQGNVQPDGAPAEPTAPPGKNPLYYNELGEFDVSGFLHTPIGFLPIAMPITEPAVGYGLALGLTFFHDYLKTVTLPDGSSRLVMSSVTMVMGAATENGTWAGGVAHLGVWNNGAIRYVGALVMYTSLNLDWFGKGNSLNGSSIPYNNDLLIIVQNIKFKLGKSDFFVGPTYRFLSSDASFDLSGLNSGIPDAQLQSKTSAVGVEASYDSLDHPFAPTHGLRANIVLSQAATWLGGDYDYTKLQTFAIDYVPLSDQFVLGLKLNGDFATGDTPFFDLPGVIVRGLARGRYVDNTAIYGEAELRYDFAKRWTAVGFGGFGMVGSTIDNFGDDGAHFAGGAGFRYLIAEKYGIRMGIDLAYGDGVGTIYVGVGTGWVRP